MDYFNDAFTFLGLEPVSCIALCKVRKLLDSIKNILICVPKMNKGLTGWEQQGE